MSKRHRTYGGVLKWHHKDKVIEQVRPLAPPTHNARFITKIKQEYPEYTLMEEWRNKKPGIG